MALKREDLLKYAYEHKDIYIGESSVFVNDCDILEFLFDNCEITVPPENRFFVRVNCGNIQNLVLTERVKVFNQQIKNSGLSEGEDARAYTGYYDFNHTSPEWESVISLGIYGLRERIKTYLLNNSDKQKEKFYKNLLRVYNASLRFIKRAADAAEKEGKYEMAQGLSNLSRNPPQNMFEAMQTSFIYYVLQISFDGTIPRTLGRIDKLFYPYFRITDTENVKTLLQDYLKEVDSFKYDANIPFAIGGTDENGNSTVNELSHLILNTYSDMQTSYVKIHLLCDKSTPDNLIRKAFEAVRNGKNSIVFMSDRKIVESLKKLGEEYKDAVNYHVVGCYECGGNNEITCSCNARVNLPKALELVLNNGRDMLTGKLVGIEHNRSFKSFEDLYKEFLRQMNHLSECAMKVTDIYESNYKKIHSAPIFSGTYTSALEKGGDIYCDYAAKYNNSSVNALGLGTVVDALTAIQKLVFEEKIITLEKLIRILKSNWENEEQLRLTIKNKLPKYGMGNSDTDNLAKNITDVLASVINGRPNAKNGVYRLGLFSIDWKWEFGEKTAASADGRLSGEPLSQNSGASVGADKEGATAHLLSVTKIDASNTPNGTIVDIDLHSSAVQGENGLNVLSSTLRTHLDLGGFAVHYNVLNTEILKAAKINADKYPNLQVRLCGWNALFSNLTEKQKDEFITRSER